MGDVFHKYPFAVYATMISYCWRCINKNVAFGYRDEGGSRRQNESFLLVMTSITCRDEKKIFVAMLHTVLIEIQGIFLRFS